MAGAYLLYSERARLTPLCSELARLTPLCSERAGICKCIRIFEVEETRNRKLAVFCSLVSINLPYGLGNEGVSGAF